MRFRSTILLATLCLWGFGFSTGSPAQQEPDQVPGRSPDQARLKLLQDEYEGNPANLKVALVLAAVLRNTGHANEATAVVENSIEAVENKIKSQGDSAELYFLAATGALFLNRSEYALERFQIALALEPEREEIHLGLIQSLLNLEREQEAKEAIDLASAIFPDSSAIKRQRVQVSVASGQQNDAIALLEELYATNPEDQVVFNRLLRAYVDVGDADKASPLFQQLVEAGSISSIEAAIHVFRIHLKKEDLRSARIELQKAVREDENHPLVKDAFREYYSLQAEKAEAGKNYQRAILFWERVLERVPDDWKAQYHLALAHAALQDHEKAIDYFLHLLEQQPIEPAFYANFAFSLIELDRLKAAHGIVELGLKLESESLDQNAISRLHELRAQLITAGQIPSNSGNFQH